jgi:hypothetical protein
MILTAVVVSLTHQAGKTTVKSHYAPVPYREKNQATTKGRLVSRPAGQQGLPAPVPSPHPPGSLADGDWTSARIVAIHELGCFDDAASLQKILAELRNPLPQIRAAALDATRAFGSRDAIPHLAVRAAETGEPLEQMELLDLIEHLKLPTVVEQLDADPVQ